MPQSAQADFLARDAGAPPKERVSVMDLVKVYRNCQGRQYETDAANYVRFTAGDFDIEPDSDAGYVSNLVVREFLSLDPG